MASAIGWSLYCSAPEAKRKRAADSVERGPEPVQHPADASQVRSSGEVARWQTQISTSSGRPVVRVPVLSIATALTVPAASMYAPPRTKMPLRAAQASAESVEAGDEMTKAHGLRATSNVSA